MKSFQVRLLLVTAGPEGAGWMDKGPAGGAGPAVWAGVGAPALTSALSLMHTDHDESLPFPNRIGLEGLYGPSQLL